MDEKSESVSQLTDAKLGEMGKSLEVLRTAIEEIQKGLGSVQKLASDATRNASEAVAKSYAELASVEAVKSRIAEAMLSIDQDTRRANSESGFAFNAKNNAEEHAKAIAQIRGTVEATFSALTANKASIDELVQTVTALRASAETDGREIAELKVGAGRDAQVIQTSSERVAAVVPAIEKGAADANAITAAKSEVDASLSSVRALQTQMAELVAAAGADAASISKFNGEARTTVGRLAESLTTAKEADARVNEYQQQLAGFHSAHGAMVEKLEGLLPHATSTGLASAFHIQKGRFSKPQRNWLLLFVATIAALLVAGLWGLPASNDTWDAILRHFVNRLPIVAPLVWLAIYAGHHYNMALRMEEDYAFKEAVSTAFEGYKREMQGIQPADGSSVSPLVTLCENVLKALSERPGRIYDGRSGMVTPITPAASAIKEILESMKEGKR